jgi:hypothetical protein
MSIYSTKDAFDLYVYYLALKRHFTSNYDFFKYNGKVKANARSFENRKDKFFFYKLTKYPNPKDHILANVVENPDVWIGDLLEDKAKDVYDQWLKIRESLSYTFRTDLGKLDYDDPNKDIVTSGEHPNLLKLYMQGQFHIESLIILDDMMKIFSYWDKNIQDTILWPDINRKCRNYKPFLQYEKSKMRKIVLDKYKHLY